MSRRADPERIFQAGRAAIRNRQMSTGIDEATANRRCDAWVLEAAGRRLPEGGDYWQSSFDWIQEERAARRPGWT
jgi:hypothetical protein